MKESNPVPVNPPTEYEDVYIYRNPDGVEYAKIFRLHNRKADPWRLNPNGLWEHRMPVHRFPYRVEKLHADGRPVLIVEGEKCVDAAVAKLKNLDVIGWMGGARSPHKTDWDCLEGRDVTLWPDADENEAGLKAMTKMAEIASKAKAASVRMMKPEPERNKDGIKGWDVDNAIEEGIDVSDYIEQADYIEAEAVAEDRAARPRPRGPSQADRLVELTVRNAVLFADGDEAFVDLTVDGHRETWAVKSKGFRRWLRREFYVAEDKKSPRAEAMQQAVATLEAMSVIGSPQKRVFLRVGEAGQKLYIDLADDAWRAIEVDAIGWRIVSDPPVRFRRGESMQALPVPESGDRAESLAALQKFCNVSRESDFQLIVAWLLAALRPEGPYPVLALGGEQGTAKSTLCRLLRSLVDPSSMPLRSPPRDDRDVFIATRRAHVLAFDNVSGLPPWLSDVLCRMATGGGYATRSLFTDDEETILNATRPVIINGIGDIVTRGDLADRAIHLTLDPIPETQRRLESDLLMEFEACRPRILGALLDAISEGLRRLPTVRLERLPRMADFAKWATACEPALWPEGAFMKAYGANRAAANEAVIESSAIGATVVKLIDGTGSFEGTTTDLLERLNGLGSDFQRKARGWPATASALGFRLARLAPSLRETGIECEKLDRHKGSRWWRITKRPSGEEKAQNPASPAIPATRKSLKLLDGGSDDSDGGDLPPISAGGGEEALDEAGEERAAIMEYEGGMAREEAESRVREDVRPRPKGDRK